ncbi:hypothetical protein [Vibrio splendidus]|uniref:hypothetical protein n=1 Tax=Vibrio splendidus TaxID=29497 RepID=UPI0039A5FA6C
MSSPAFSKRSFNPIIIRVANIYMIRLHKADQREHLPRLSDLHLLVLKIHRAVCKPCGPLLSFLFQISHTPLCFLLAAHVEFRFVLSTKPVKFYLADSPLNFHAEFLNQTYSLL